MTTLAPPEPEASQPEATGERRSLPRWVWAVVVVGGWLLIHAATKGNDTLARPTRERTKLTDRFTEFNNDVLASRDSNPIIRFTYWLGEQCVDTVDWLQRMVSVANLPRPVPEIGWLGVTVAAVSMALVIANWRIAILVAATFFSFGVFGYWSSSIDLLIVTFVAVGAAVLIGMPLAIWIASSRRAERAVTALLDLMQTMPTFVYLVPIVLFFGIGPSAAVVCTLIYSLPPLVRIAGHGIRSVSPTTIEATDSAGQTFWQRLVKVQLPMARATIVVGLNQTIMAALAMATIAAYVNGPGLGKDVLRGLRTADIGAGFVPGALIVLIAIMLDRTATAASQRSERVTRGGGENPRQRVMLIGGGVVATLVAVYVSRYYSWAAEFPESEWGLRTADRVNSLTDWFIDTFGDITRGIKDAITTGLLNPLESLLSESPWYLAALAIALLAFVLGGARALTAAVVGLIALRLLDYWHNAMVTLSMTLVATLLVMALALVFGVWMARSRRVDVVLRPLLDAGQTIPPFVFLIPVVALFQNGKFSAIVAAIVYAAPAATKLVADGVKGVSATTLEASRSTGCTTWQEITKVQLPMARGSLVLATNQGLLYVLAMVVIGGLVGGGALGYDVVLGISRSEEWGRGALAGLSIVVLGIMLDRIARAAARDDRSAADPMRRRWRIA